MLESTTCFKFPDWNVGKGKREREREREKSPVKCAHMKEGTEVVTESIAFCSFFLLFLLFLLSILLFLNRFPPDSEPFQKRKFVSMKLLMLHSSTTAYFPLSLLRLYARGPCILQEPSRRCGHYRALAPCMVSTGSIVEPKMSHSITITQV